MDVRRLDEMQAQGRSIFDTELAVAYYARVSTDKDEQINSLGNQKRYFEDCIAANPHWTFAGGYVDEGISGTSVEGREQFLRMIEDAKKKFFADPTVDLCYPTPAGYLTIWFQLA